MRDTLTGRGQVNYNDLTDAEAADLKALVRQFLEGNATLDQLPCDTLKQVKEAYKQMQIAYQAAKAVSHDCSNWKTVQVALNCNKVQQYSRDHLMCPHVAAAFAVMRM